MKSKSHLIYWRSGRLWLGGLLEYPEIITQCGTLEELEENIREAHRLMALESVQTESQVKGIAL